MRLVLCGVDVDVEAADRGIGRAEDDDEVGKLVVDPEPDGNDEDEEGDPDGAD